MSQPRDDQPDADADADADAGRKRWRLRDVEMANLVVITVFLGLAADYAQFLAGEIHTAWQLAFSCATLVLFTVGVVMLLRRMKHVRTWLALVAVILAATVGAVGGYVSRGHGGLRDESGAAAGGVRLKIDPLPPDVVSSQDITLTGTLSGQLAPGATLWTVVSKASADEKFDEPHYLQPGPCVLAAGQRWTCKHVRVGGAGAWRFTMLVVDSETTNSYVERRLAGQRKDSSGSKDEDRRNFVGPPPEALLKESIASPVA